MTHFRMRHADGVRQILDQLSLHLTPSARSPAADPAAAPRPVGALRALAVAAQRSLGLHPGASSAPPAAERAPAADDSALIGEAVSSTEARDVFRGFIYLTQVQQALIYEAAAQSWRAAAPSAPRRRTMGLLYWQLNDVWQGPSWSGIDLGGHWKPLHYAARRFFAPVAVSAAATGMISGGDGGRPRLGLVVNVVNDLSVHVDGTLAVDLVRYDAAQADAVHAAYAGPVRVAAFGAEAVELEVEVLSAALEQFAKETFVRVRFCPAAFTSAGHHSPLLPDPAAAAQAAIDAAFNWSAPAADTARQEAASACAGPRCAAARRLLRCSEAILPLTELKDADLALARVEVAQARDGGGGAVDVAAVDDVDGAPCFEVVVQSDRVAFHVVLESTIAGAFSDNAFVLLPWEPRALRFTPRSRASLPDFQASLRVMWLEGVVVPSAGTAPGAGNSAASGGAGLAPSTPAAVVMMCCVLHLAWG
jgi:beta-mannosidase